MSQYASLLLDNGFTCVSISVHHYSHDNSALFTDYRKPLAFEFTVKRHHGKKLHFSTMWFSFLEFDAGKLHFWICTRFLNTKTTLELKNGDSFGHSSQELQKLRCTALGNARTEIIVAFESWRHTGSSKSKSVGNASTEQMWDQCAVYQWPPLRPKLFQQAWYR